MNEDAFLDGYYESQTEIPEHNDECDSGWPGDGSGFDDFEDMNQNEAADYQDEDAGEFDDGGDNDVENF